MRNALYLIFIFMVVAVVGCGDDDNFVVEGELDGAPAVNLRVIYHGNGRLATGITATNEGKFSFHGFAPKRMIVELYDNDYRLLGRTIAVNGEHQELKLKQHRPYEASVKGNELAQRWSEFLNQHADSFAAGNRNDIIADYVKNNPADELSGLLLITDFDCSGTKAALADSLWNSLAAETRPDDLAQSFIASVSRFSTENTSRQIEQVEYLDSTTACDTFKLADSRLSLIAVSNNLSKRDSIVKTFRQLDSLLKDNKFEIIDLSVDTDNLVWRRLVDDDHATWIQGWVPGSISSRSLNVLAIPEVPYFVAVDSTGTQLWRGTDPTDAKEFILEYYD